MLLASTNDYELQDLVGEGASGKVFKGTHRPTKDVVAIKVIKTDKNQERSAKEEVSLLQQLGHVPNVIPLRDSIISPANSECVLIFPYFEHDLSGLLSENRFSIAQAKSYLKQLLIGVHGMHTSGFMHRDIKAANLLLNNKGQLVIGDLGTAAQYTKKGSFSDKVVTLWYRAPELLLGCTNYGPEVDMWSIGCVFIELMTSKNFLPGANEQEQLDRIFKTCGTPTDESYPGVVSLPGFSSLQNVQVYPRRLQEILSKEGFTRDALELVDALLALDPCKRPTAQQALGFKFFSNEPLPLELAQMPAYPPVHVLDLRRKREIVADKSYSRISHSQHNPHHAQYQGHSRHQSPQHNHSRHPSYHHSPQHSPTHHSRHSSPTHNPRHSPQHSPQYVGHHGNWSHSQYPNSPNRASPPHYSHTKYSRHTESPHKHYSKLKTIEHTGVDHRKPPLVEHSKEKLDTKPVEKEKMEQIKEKKREAFTMVVHIPTALYINGDWPEVQADAPKQKRSEDINPYLRPAKKRNTVGTM